MLKVGMVGVGGMGRGHVSNYLRLMAEGAPVKLVALCDVDPEKLAGKSAGDFNMKVGNEITSLNDFAKYTDYNEMFAKEDLDYVDIATPTYLHAPIAVAAMKAGLHVLSEKPMSINLEGCQEMIKTAKETGKKLMVAQCLRFWPAYEYLKETVASGRYGKPVSGYFWRGGGPPAWSWQDWMRKSELSGGCLLDQHVHDVDMIHWVFGKPTAVSTVAAKGLFTDGYDAVSTNYLYPGMAINAQDDWTISCKDYSFNMLYRVNFEKGALVFENGKVTDYPADGEAFEPKLDEHDGYYREMRYFIDAIINDTPIETAAPESTMLSIKVALAEMESASKNGAVVTID